MIEPLHMPTFPVGPIDFSRIVEDAGRSPDATLSGQPLIASLSEVMQTFCGRAEAVARSIDVVSDDLDAIEINAAENRLLGVHDGFPSIDIPQCLEWTDIGHDFAALSPPALRAGSYYSPCNASMDTGFFVHAIMWKYLAARFAFHQAAIRHRRNAHASGTVYECFENSQRAVVSAARTQRKILDQMCLDRNELNGQCIALTVRKQPSDDDAHLFAINDLGKTCHFNDELVSRASAALKTTEEQSINHNIIFADSLSDPAGGSAVFIPLTGVRVFGHSDRIRYIFIVSRVSDQISGEEEDGSYVALSKPRLRDAFWRRHDASPAHQMRGESELLVRSSTKEELPAMELPTKVNTPDAQNNSTVNSAADVIFTPDEPVISRAKVARAFFGYRGLKTPGI